MTAPRPLTPPRDQIVAAMQRIYRYRMTTTSGGNVSVRDEAGGVWITPARVDKGNLTRDDIVRVASDGTVDGQHKPSSEYPFHKAIYAVRPDIGAVVHAHPVALVAFSICRETPDTALIPQAAHVCGPVGYAAYELPGSQALGERIAETFAEGFHCVMLENHGVVIGGRDLADAFARFETLEFAAKTAIKAAQLGPARHLTPDQLALAERPRGVLEGFTPAAPTTAEQEARRTLADFIRRGYRQRLLTSTGGSFSARLDDDSFIITAYGIDRDATRPEDLVLVHNGQAEHGRRPSRAVAMHRAIYRAHPDATAVVNAMPVNATAYSVTDATLDARTIPESYVFLGEVPTVPLAAQYGDGSAVARIVSTQRPVALMENNGALVVGKSVLDAFDRLEVLECTAEALIDSRPLGPLKPMDERQVDELRKAFGVP